MKVLAIKSRHAGSSEWLCYTLYKYSEDAARRSFNRRWLDSDSEELKLVYIDEDTERELEVLIYRRRS